MTEYAVGIDLGGTNIKFVCLSPQGDLLCREQVETGDSDAPRWPDTIAETLEKLRRRQGASPTHIGLCAPGLVAEDSRSIRWMGGRLEILCGLDWSERLGAPVRVVNDAHAAQLI